MMTTALQVFFFIGLVICGYVACRDPEHRDPESEDLIDKTVLVAAIYFMMSFVVLGIWNS